MIFEGGGHQGGAVIGAHIVDAVKLNALGDSEGGDGEGAFETLLGREPVEDVGNYGFTRGSEE